MSILNILLGLALAALVAILFTGIAAFARGGEFHRRHGNRMMNLRVATQGLVLLILVLIILTKSLGS
ncbi:HIG1 domain-containing protein [Telmatospirillum sp. J64-1]|uniref:HIG1 domain-containing protein n=1 Tax=Telmatospirillum sp. J64-1 TaxID=2502183 RepID=UPI002105F1CE|nr:HIG1 domain-containing protein [Telmatospirillum sp. J64-1]